MRNPWSELPANPPFVLPNDRPLVEDFNRRAQPEHQLDLDLIPQPFLGSRDAPLVILGANPDLKGGHSAGQVAAAIRANMEPDPLNHRLIGLLAAFESTPNALWWRDGCLSKVIASGLDPEKLASRVLDIELHGYHSQKWRQPQVTFPSQEYGFWLVAQAIDRGATIVALRCRRHWETAVPGLADYPHLVTKQNRLSRSKAISEGNLGKKGFEAVLSALA